MQHSRHRPYPLKRALAIRLRKLAQLSISNSNSGIHEPMCIFFSTNGLISLQLLNQCTNIYIIELCVKTTRCFNCWDRNVLIPLSSGSMSRSRHTVLKLATRVSASVSCLGSPSRLLVEDFISYCYTTFSLQSRCPGVLSTLYCNYLIGTLSLVLRNVLGGLDLF